MEDKWVLLYKLQFPLSYEKVFSRSTVRILKEYIDLLNEFSIEKTIVDQVCKFTKAYELCIKNYNQGKHRAAYNNFENAIQCVSFDSKEIIRALTQIDFF